VQRAVVLSVLLASSAAAADGGVSLGYGTMGPLGHYTRGRYAPGGGMYGAFELSDALAVGGTLSVHYGGGENQFLMVGPSLTARVDRWFGRVVAGAAFSQHHDSDGSPGDRSGVAAGVEVGARIAQQGGLATTVSLAASYLFTETSVVSAGFGVQW